MASINTMTHSSNKYNGESLGENLYWGPLNSNIETSTVDMWYMEIADYDFNNPGCEIWNWTFYSSCMER